MDRRRGIGTGIRAAGEWLRRQPYVDGRRIGVYGGSYGGFLTHWLIGETDRFRDVITGINGSKVYEASDVNRAMERLEKLSPEVAQAGIKSLLETGEALPG